MGITGELVRSVFSRNRSGTHESHARSSASEKKRWSAVRVYLCGDEFNSVLAEEDSASVKSSEATVTQPILDDAASKGDSEYEETEDSMPNEKHNSTSRLFQQEDAATVIQTAFRNFLARRRREDKELKDETQELNMGTESPSRDSVGTSMEVQTGHSVEVLSVKQENLAAHLKMQKKSKTQVLKIKEDWDDSTVSSNISKMRIQNRLEATNRRERALAYAFAQQLRICSRRKQTRSDGTEPNMGWSWLERWMATRLPEYSVESRTSKPFDPLHSNHKLPECSVESRTSKQYDPTNSNQNQNVAARMKFFDAGEEKESCGSNEVSAQFDSISMTETKDNDKLKTHKNPLKSTRTISRRKTVPSCQCPKENTNQEGEPKGE
ncbi:protein IQ-DOMAIN 33 isoform X2 [Euphorbia lathyris]|uniref:protein IQ-DOMAIN 33 isoform X2 n=1 Tax=Euphorbia lathyris TaxID=212925 RepID=UPI0033135B15